jgi:hypothetical protein
VGDRLLKIQQKIQELFYGDNFPVVNGITLAFFLG